MIFNNDMRFVAETVKRYKIEYDGQVFWFNDIEDIEKNALKVLLSFFAKKWVASGHEKQFVDAAFSGAEELRKILSLEVPTEGSEVKEIEKRLVDV
jgi:hypothetical protein